MPRQQSGVAYLFFGDLLVDVLSNVLLTAVHNRFVAAVSAPHLGLGVPNFTGVFTGSKAFGQFQSVLVGVGDRLLFVVLRSPVLDHSLSHFGAVIVVFFVGASSHLKVGSG